MVVETFFLFPPTQLLSVEKIKELIASISQYPILWEKCDNDANHYYYDINAIWNLVSEEVQLRSKK